MSEDTNVKASAEDETTALEAATDEGSLEDEPDDDTPQDGDILEPGLHLIELVTRTPCRRDVIVEGLRRMGFDGALPDQSRARAEQSFPIREHRLIGDLKQSITLHQRDIMQWTYARRLAMSNIGRDPREYRLRLETFDLEPGVLYEALFLSREQTQPSRAIVEENLNEMGFIPVKLSAIHRNARIPGRQQTSVTSWFGLLEWDSTPCQVSEDDPFYFEELIAI